MVRVTAPQSRQLPLTLRQPRPSTILVGVGGYLAVTYAAFISVDVLDVGGSRSWVAERVPDTGALWIHIFGEASITEMLQWSLLAYLVVLSAVMGGWLAHETRTYDAGVFWRLIAVASILMVMEDAGNVRHRLWEYTYVGLGLPSDHVANLAVRGGWYAVIGGLFLWAIFAHSGAVRSEAPVRRLGAVGVVMYAIASSMSILQPAIGWYEPAGAFIEREVLRTELAVPPIWTQDELHHGLMDFVVEESLELVGAAFLLAAALAYYRTAAGGSTTDP